jgi:hypothetical protein
MPKSGRRTARSVIPAAATRPHSTDSSPLDPRLQVFIKDVKSSNGTFVNGERLSAEATESEPYELKSEDHLVRRTPPLHSLVS